MEMDTNPTKSTIDTVNMHKSHVNLLFLPFFLRRRLSFSLIIAFALIPIIIHATNFFIVKYIYITDKI